MSEKTLLSIVIPIYNEEQCIELNLKRILDFFSDKFHVELIVVDDGSGDATNQILNSFKADYPHACLKIVELSRNFGQSTAILAGLNYSEGELVGIMDADLQDPPEIMLAMIELLEKEKVDVVFGVRKKRIGESPLKIFFAWSFYRVLNFISQISIPEDTGEFRIMRKKVVQSLLETKEHEPYVRGLVAWIGFKQIPYYFERPMRNFGTTKYRLYNQLQLAIKAITSFSSLPLIFAMWLGLFGIFLGGLLFLWSVYSWYIGGGVRGWASLIAITAIMNSIGFLLTGINGVYLGRIYGETMNRPRFIIRNFRKISF